MNRRPCLRISASSQAGTTTQVPATWEVEPRVTMNSWPGEFLRQNWPQSAPESAGNPTSAKQ